MKTADSAVYLCMYTELYQTVIACEGLSFNFEIAMYSPVCVDL